MVGVIDTGIDYNHEDLAANVWNSPAPFSVTTQSGVVLECPTGTHGFNMVATVATRMMTTDTAAMCPGPSARLETTELE